MNFTKLMAFALFPLALSSCTVLDIEEDNSLPGLRVDGLLSGHAAFGMSDESGLFEARIFDGPSSGGIASLRISNLLGLEVGLLGAAFNLGPIHLGLGTLFYDPEPPYFEQAEDVVEVEMEDDGQ
ncbi:MAG: hypothetical protein ACI9D0_000164 [Bacteroidia bacterium]|jgi:hypothetical protein